MDVWVGKRVVVAGGAGFIGAHLNRALIGAGAGVAVVDDLSTGLRQRYLAALKVRDIVALDRLPMAAHSVFNRACPASPRAY